MVTFSRATVIPSDGTSATRRPPHSYDYFAVGVPADHGSTEKSIMYPILRTHTVGRRLHI